MNRQYCFALCISSALFFACGDDAGPDTPDTGTKIKDAGVVGSDSGARPEAGFRIDSGVLPDAAPTSDAGFFDSGLQQDAGVTPDAGGNPDSGTPTDGGGGQSFVGYYWGDFVTDGVEQVGAIGTASAAPVVLNLQGLEGGDAIMSVAIGSAGLAVAGRSGAGDSAVINLYAADGSGAPVTLATAPDAARSFLDLAFSPDGQWLAFRADLDTDDAMRLYVVPSTGGAAPVALSPDTADGLLDVTDFAWSSDVSGAERIIAYVGDLVTNDVNGLWTVDATSGTPSPVEIVTQLELSATTDVQGVLEFDWMGRIYFKSDFEVDDVFRLYRANPDGSGREQVPGTALFNGNESWVGTYGISDDGMNLAFSSDSPIAGLYQVFVMPLNTNTPALVTSATVTPGAASTGPSFFSPIEHSPDGTRIAFTSDWAVNAGDPDNGFALFVVDASPPGGETRLFGAPANDLQDVSELGFTADSSRLVFWGDLVANNDNEVYSTTDFTTEDQSAAAALVQDVPMGGDIFGLVMVR